MEYNQWQPTIHSVQVEWCGIRFTVIVAQPATTVLSLLYKFNWLSLKIIRHKSMWQFKSKFGVRDIVPQPQETTTKNIIKFHNMTW